MASQFYMNWVNVIDREEKIIEDNGFWKKRLEMEFPTQTFSFYSETQCRLGYEEEEKVPGGNSFYDYLAARSQLATGEELEEIQRMLIEKLRSLHICGSCSYPYNLTKEEGRTDFINHLRTDNPEPYKLIIAEVNWQYIIAVLFVTSPQTIQIRYVETTSVPSLPHGCYEFMRRTGLTMDSFIQIYRLESSHCNKDEMGAPNPQVAKIGCLSLAKAKPVPGAQYSFTIKPIISQSMSIGDPYREFDRSIYNLTDD